MPEQIALGQPTTGDAEVEAVRRVLESGWVAGQGPMSREFEAAFAERVNSPHALAVNNCTAGLHLALLSQGVGPGDEVIVADYTYPATAHAVLFCGATPRFADVAPSTALIDPASVESLVTERTVGIMAVDTFGQCADYDELGEIARRSGVFLVEDAACAAGATYHGRPAGHPELADIAAFSLHGRKGITSGEGGVVTTGLADAAAFINKHMCFGVESALARAGSDDLAVPVFDELGFNYKLSDIASAIALVQLGRLDDLLSARRRIAERYAASLGQHDLFTLPTALDDREHPWQSYVLTLDPSVPRGVVARQLREEGIGCNIGTFACHVQPVYGSSDVCPVSADLFARHLAIPMHANLTDGQVDRVAEAVRRAVTSASTAAA